MRFTVSLRKMGNFRPKKGDFTVKTKIIAYFLPQYHRIRENDEWWGEGFTEWTNLKKAKPLFEGHNQPLIPLNDNYYDLMDMDSVRWQTDLCQKYKIYGFAYYHYWFEGKMLLEKPAENLLRDTDIQQRFFFLWANHTWYKAENGRKSVLREQTYGDETDWIDHYNYMHKFFLDARYIKVKNCPVIGIYIPNDIPEYDCMIDKWNELARRDGFDGLHVIESINSKDKKTCSDKSNASVIRQPNISIQKYRMPQNPINRIFFNTIRRIKVKFFHKKMFFKYDFQRIMQYEAQERTSSYRRENEKIYYGISTGWDNTPRHGKRGAVMINKSVETFKKTFEELYKKSILENNEFIFINAWNEWAEGMYLEPDMENGYAYLEAIRDTYNAYNDMEDNDDSI